MRSIGELLALAADHLAERVGDRVYARRAVEECLAHLLGMRRLDLYMQWDRPLNESEVAPFRALFKRLLTGEPLDYILGEVLFAGCRCLVDRSVLIPRPETELLWHAALKEIDRACTTVLPEERVAWDLCTGSGCLGIALKRARPSLSVVLTDLSEAALERARSNAQLNGVELALLQGDLGAPMAGRKVHFILCNPPYISDADYEKLDRSVKDFEPPLALRAGPRGWEFYARLAAELPAHLRAGGLLFLELGTGQGERVKSLFDTPDWCEPRLERDWAGHDRFFFCQRSSVNLPPATVFT